jgi:hypothetical protein
MAPWLPSAVAGVFMYPNFQFTNNLFLLTAKAAMERKGLAKKRQNVKNLTEE